MTVGSGDDIDVAVVEGSDICDGREHSVVHCVVEEEDLAMLLRWGGGLRRLL